MKNIIDSIKNATTREGVRELINPLKKAQLMELGKLLKITFKTGATVAMIRGYIEQRTIGLKSDMEAILSC